jgi:transposase
LENQEILLTDKQRQIINQFSKSSTISARLVQRSQIILHLSHGKSIREAAQILGITKKTVQKWKKRWSQSQERLFIAENNKHIKKLEYVRLVADVLNDAPRSGAPAAFTAEQVTRIVAIACEVIDDSDRPYSRWTHKDIAREAIDREIVESISTSSITRFLKEASIKPHLSVYWCNTTCNDSEAFKKDAQNICDLYQQAVEFHKQGIHLISNDEKTGIQALQRTHKTYTAQVGGQKQRVEHNYTRHGTLCLIANLEIATGKIIEPTIGPTRTEEDYLNHISRTVATDPKAEWIFVTDQLNTHKSESLVKWVATQCNINCDLGVKGKRGILKSQQSRQKFLSDKSHRIRFEYTPKHASWLNQIEIWFSILSRRLIKHGNFKSLEHLKNRIMEFITFFNKVMAKPFKWTYKSRPLTA